MKLRLFGALAVCTSCGLFAQQTPTQTKQDSIESLNEVVISAKVLLGSKFEAQNRTGSAYYISPAELKQHNYTDINRVFNSVPGVNVYEEDGFGLRPNISLRGTSPERSSKITIMEDGVLIAPAPYSAPAAYYFPNVARMEAVEILKGSSQVQYGPFTSGGAINFVSTPIPTAFSGSVLATYGSFNTSNLHVKAGNSHKNFGYMLEYQNYRSNGFKDLDNGGDTGFDKDDLVAKFKVNTNPEAKIGQELEFKFQYSDETSDETYLGLTEADFSQNPFRRYAASQKDQMNAEHLQFMATHILAFSDYFKITTTGYYNEFSRNWFKLNDLNANGARVNLTNLLEDPASFPEAYSIITGVSNSDANALRMKNNNREYTSKGVQTKFDYHWYTGTVFHDLEVGMRYHYDEEDRFQWVDTYDITNGIMTLNTAGTPGTDANRISDANAFASYVLYKIKFNNWTFTPGLRYENITLGQQNYGTSDLNRTGSNLTEKENKVDVFIPGIGFNYRFDNNFNVFGGVHKGFSPPGNSAGEKPEESINYELGSRFNFLGFAGEVVGFYNDYSNLLGSDLAATGGTGSLDQFNAGEVEVKGLELLLNYDILSGRSTNFRIPVNFSYTYTHTEFKNSFESGSEIWGVVEEGDEMPYIPNHQFFAGIGLEHAKFAVNLNGRYRGEFRTIAGTGEIPANYKVDSNFIVDLSAKYHLNSNFSFTGNIINALNNEYAASRVPSGLRPGHPFGAYIGINARF
ncbi:TonB-dependent receptor [Antarcticibacterium arcticum]|uniref:TonB-dependent receptor n=1 Tax=Antarcticibacterium arcticum TaxID=2585771 RepID=A0A5B8YFI2_9FLAO|nr:TonB-dependent receptor [Antarcticibacterium arcticum]QED36321.1 TonB-dependent receptor [Antarcticibacterium arcticum]